MESGGVVGHETMGEVVEVGPGNNKLKKGDRVGVPFTISCGECFFCKRGFFSDCERSNPNAEQAAELWGHLPAGRYGYSHLLGRFPGSQAEYLRVPFVDKLPMGSAINRGLTFRMAQTPVQHYLPKLVKLIEDGKIDPSLTEGLD